MSAREKDAVAPTAPLAAEGKTGGGAPGRSTLGAEGADGVAGSGLPYRQRSLFQASLGTDLSGVRVRTDDAAAQTADAHDARAIAVNNEIMFAKGEYRPDTPEGDHLLAHEVAHTVQQSGAAPADGELKTTKPGDSVEKGADTAAAAMVQGQSASVESAPTAIARKGKDEDIAPPELKVDAPTNANGAPATDDGKALDPNAPSPTNGKQGELDGDLSVMRVGADEVEGTEPVGPPQNLERGKAELAAKAATLPPDGGAEELKTGGPKVEGGGGGGGGGDVQMTEDIQLAIQVAQADAKEGAAEAQAEAAAYKAAMSAERDRFDQQQEALTLEQLKAMSAADKRSTMIEMGYDEKSVKKMKDAELDGIITGKLVAEQRKTRILGMDPEELRALSPDRKMQFLVDLGVDQGDLQKIGPQKTSAAFDQVISQAHIPGQHKVKIKIKGGFIGIGKKEWEIKLDVDAEGNPEFDVEKKGGWLSKLWGWVKAALPIIALVLAPLTGGASLIALAVYQTVSAIASGDWLGAVIGAAGAIVGVGALKMIKDSASSAAQAFHKIADVASKVKNVAVAAKASMVAAKAKSPGGLLAALSTGASAFADFAAKSAENFAATMKGWATKLEKWGRVITGGEQVVQGIKAGDPAAAVAGAFEGAAAAVSNQQKQPDGSVKETSKSAATLERYSRIATYASMGTRAAKSQPPDYGGIVDAAMSIAGEYKTGGKFETATKITSAAGRLTRAIQTNNPSEIAAAALGLAEQIQLAKIGQDDDGEEGKGTPDEERAKITKRYAVAASAVRSASAAITAVVAKPRPNYPAALEATTQLIADLTENKKLDQVATLTRTFDAWTAAVRSKNDDAILAAGAAFGGALNGMKELILGDRDAAKKAAQADAPKDKPAEGGGEDDGGGWPNIPVGALDLSTLPGTVVPISALLPEPARDAEGNAIAIDELGPQAPTEDVGPKLNPRGNTPNANYTIVSGDTLSGIAKLFNVTQGALRNANPQLDGDKIFVGQKIVVPGLISVVVKPGDPAQTPGEPGQAPKPPLPPVVMGVDVDVNGRLISRSTRGIISATKTLGKMADWPGEVQGFIASINNAVTVYEKAVQDNKTYTDTYRDAVAYIRMAADANMWADAVLKKLAGYEGEFRDLLNIDSSNQAIQAISIFGRTFRSLATAINLPATVVDMIDKFEKLKSGNPIERVNAANSILATANSLPREIAYMVKFAKIMLAGPIETVSGAIGVMRSALARFGGNVQEQMLNKVFIPALDEVGKTRGGAMAMKLAQALSGEVSTWAAGAFARATTSAALRTAATGLVSTLGGVTAFVLSAPVQFAIAYYSWLSDFLPEVFFGARDGSSVMLSQYLYGEMVHVKKSEIRQKPVSALQDARDTIKYFYNGMLTGKAWVRQGWPAYAVERLGAAGAWYARYARSADELLRNTGDSDNIDAARRLQDIAVDYINKTFKDEFKFDPPV